MKFKNFRPAVMSVIVAMLSFILLLPAAAQAATVDEEIIDITGSGLAPMVLSPDGVTLAVSSWGTSEVFLIDTTTNNLRTVVDSGSLFSDQVGGLAFSPDGATLYAVVYGTSVITIDVASATATDSLVADSAHPTAFDEVWSLSITGDGRTLMLGRFGLGGVVYFDLENEVVTNIFARLNTDSSQSSAVWTPPGIVNSQFLSPDGSILYMQGYNGAIDAYSATSDPALQRRIDSASWVLTSAGVAVSDADVQVDSSCLTPDGATVFIPAGYDHDAIYKVDLATGNVLQQTTYRTPNKQNYGQWGCVVSPDGSSVFVTQPNDYEPSIVVEYSTADLSAAPIIHEIPFTVGSNYGYTYGIAVVGCDAYVSGFWQQIGIIRNIGCVPDVPNNDQQTESASLQLANTGSTPISYSLLSLGAVFVGVLGVMVSVRLRSKN